MTVQAGHGLVKSVKTGSPRRMTVTVKRDNSAVNTRIY